jgi:uncharacterized protein (TIGR02145 family)
MNFQLLLYIIGDTKLENSFMKLYIVIFLIIFGISRANSQSFTIFDVDTTNFPNLKAKFYAFDFNNKQILNLTSTDFEVKENDLSRAVLSVSCPTPLPSIPISSVLVMDISSSMSSKGLDIAKSAANVWIEMLTLDESECALTSFSDINYLNQDFTKNKTKLANGINNLTCKNGTNYNAALLDPAAGGILIAKTGKFKRVIVFLTDGVPNFPPNISQIINQAKADKISIYCVTINMKSPQYLKDISNQTGGICFENIKTKEEAEECYRSILLTAKSGEPCSIEWQSDITCLADLKNLEFKLIPGNIKRNLSYQSSYSSESKLEFKPLSLKFLNSVPGNKQYSNILVTAVNADFNVTNIISSNPLFEFSPTSFSLKKGKSTNLTISFLPVDSGYNFCKFIFENNLCPANYTVSGGYQGKKPKIKTLKLIYPNGDQEFVVGKNYLITWDGILSDEIVKIDYSIDNGVNWLPIKDTASGLSYKWLVPKTLSKLCIARVKSITKSVDVAYECNNSDIKICNQLWMGCNLNVTTYRNGDKIPEVQDSAEWANLITGAWCYYENDPATGAVYGKLYNWYAVHDPRGLAPNGWHIPSDADWTVLENCLGGPSLAGGKLKEANLTHWLSPNINATNDNLFTALPGGWRYDYGSFFYLGSNGSWWSSTEVNNITAWERQMNNTNGLINRYSSGKGFGFSVRCIKD